jgi:hypothetical protein
MNRLTTAVNINITTQTERASRFRVDTFDFRPDSRLVFQNVKRRFRVFFIKSL